MKNKDIQSICSLFTLDMIEKAFSDWLPSQRIFDGVAERLRSERASSSKIRYHLYCFITYGAKSLKADWLRQRAFFLNHEGTFGNQEDMIT